LASRQPRRHARAGVTETLGLVDLAKISRNKKTRRIGLGGLR
jgi:hypothetical protein